MDAPKEIYIYNINDNHYSISPTDCIVDKKKEHKYIRADLAELTWKDIEIIRKIIEDLDFSNKSEGMDVVTFNGTVARRFNSYRRKKK